MADGSVLDRGSYKIRVSTLRIFGDEKSKEVCDVIEPVSFTVFYRL